MTIEHSRESIVAEPVSSRDRWGVIAAYALLAAANQLLWLTFTPITTPAAHRYGVSVSDIGWLSEIFPLLYVLLAVPLASLLDRRFHSGLAAGAILTAAGGLVRLVHPTFAWALAGQVLVAIGQPFVLIAVTGVARAYLKPASRPTGIALGSAGIFLGMLCSLALGSALGGAHLHLILIVGGVYSVLAAALLLVMMLGREQPPVGGDITGRYGLRTVWRDLVIRRLAGLAFVGFGFFVALTTWLQALLKPSGVTASTAGWLLVTTVLLGVIGSATLPPLVVRKGAAHRMFRLAASVTAGACLLTAAWKSVPAIGIAIGLSGFLLLACLPVILEISERRAGSASTSATALIWLAGNAGGIVIAILVQVVVHHPLVAFLLLALIAACGLVVIPGRQALLAEVPPE